MNLSMNKIQGQCYNGVSNMAGAKKGVSKQIIDIEKVLYSRIATALH